MSSWYVLLNFLFQVINTRIILDVFELDSEKRDICKCRHVGLRNRNLTEICFNLEK
jgi:hypothetical protein